jgi:putative membrane protein
MRQFRRFAATLLGLGAFAAATAGPALAHGAAAPAPTLADALTTWIADPLPWFGVLLAAWGYLYAVRRVNRAHPHARVPMRRVLAWLGGLLVILVALTSAIDVYAEDLLTVHMVQHLLLAMVAPPLLALGAPVTLALRVAAPATRRRVLLPILHSRAVAVLASPWVAWPLFTAAMWVTHFTPLYDAALENPTLHVAEHVLFLATGTLFWWPVVAADPAPRRLSHWVRLAYLGAQMPIGAVIGLTIYFAPTVLYEHYQTLERSWGPSALIDQQIGGLLMWAAGELALLVAMALLVADWMRHDVRRSRRADLRIAGSARD